MRLKFYFLIYFVIVFYGRPCAGQNLIFDRFGGIKVKHFDIENNGFFRTTFQDNQWWFVTPENNAFLSFGINHFHAYLWAQDYNKAHWESQLGGTAWSEPWKEGFYQHAKEMVGRIGANSMGYHNEEQALLVRPKILPYIRHYVPVKFSLHMQPTPEDYVDIFAPEFVQICAAAAEEQVKPYINDTLLIGFTMADIPGLTEKWARAVNIPTWALVLRNHPGTAPGKQVYVETMQERYNSITQFNTKYQTSFNSWDDLKNTEDWRPNTDFANAGEIADNNAFNKKCMAKYYEVASTSFRAVDQNHLFFSDKLNVNLQDLNELELVIDVAKDYVDVISVQFYGREAYQIHIQNKIVEAAGNIPFINGDGGFGFHGDPRMPNPQRPTATNQSERAIWFYEYAERAFSNPNFIGWHICGVIDAWNPHGTQKAGIMNPLGELHAEVVDTARSLSTKIYSFRGIDLNIVTGFIEKEHDFISIRPNPTNGVVHLDMKGQNQQLSILVYDVIGKAISHTTVRDENLFTIDIKGNTGIYYLKIESGGKTSIYKVFKH